MQAEASAKNELEEPGRAPVRIGAHTSIAGGVSRALERASRLRCTALQIFSASPRMWGDGRRGFPPRAAADFREHRLALGLDPLVIHANYLINLAATGGRARALSIRAFRGELERAIALGADYLVVHPGSRGEADRATAARRIAEALGRATAGLALGRLRVLIEGTAGQGRVVGASAGELEEILTACPELDLGVCLDTAHLLAAGYEIRTEEGLAATLDEFDRAIGLERVRVVHVNDSKAPLGARVDRHEHLGRGQIGLEALGRMVNHPRLAGRAFLLETPIDRPGDDWRNVKTLWRLAGVEWKRPKSRVPGQGKRGTGGKGGERAAAPSHTRKLESRARAPEAGEGRAHRPPFGHSRGGGNPVAPSRLPETFAGKKSLYDRVAPRAPASAGCRAPRAMSGREQGARRGTRGGI